MDNMPQKQQNQTTEHQQTAIPYISPPLPTEITPSQRRLRSPLVNGAVFAMAILLVGFMAYNYVGHQLTQLAGVSDVREVVPTPTITPTMTPQPTNSY